MIRLGMSHVNTCIPLDGALICLETPVLLLAWGWLDGAMRLHLLMRILVTIWRVVAARIPLVRGLLTANTILLLVLVTRLLLGG
jgi:hypothetical protein